MSPVFHKYFAHPGRVGVKCLKIRPVVLPMVLVATTIRKAADHYILLKSRGNSCPYASTKPRNFWIVSSSSSMASSGCSPAAISTMLRL